MKKLTFELEGERFVHPRYFAFLRTLHVDVVDSNEGHYLNIRKPETLEQLLSIFEIPEDFIITLETYSNKKEFVVMEQTEDYDLKIQDIHCSQNGFAGIGIYAIDSADFLDNTSLAETLERYVVEPLSLIRNINKVIFEYTGRVQTVVHGGVVVGIKCLKRNLIKDDMIKAIFRERQEIILNEK